MLVCHQEVSGLVCYDLGDDVDVLAEAVSALLRAAAQPLLAKANALGLVVNHVLLDFVSLVDGSTELGGELALEVPLSSELAVVGVEVLPSHLFDLVQAAPSVLSLESFHAGTVGVGHRLRHVRARRVLERCEAKASRLLLRVVLVQEFVASVQGQ